ncbi:transcriptional adapter 2 protein, putative [Theileria equi strain WA]|uniref:Transcriptional adapter 2 protein, putative n=1 Tax=Theileria equi strain WA TaxID=1537102 RepID=L1LEI7_THEEQ|nr:transcriptional adapter 2 protein, putative [Theileria equi strain WA]EKX73837.1 transcriptional adapter 2 protein, putative [Theileria equi strain WA]|eukprot:XP_004833289.1 transcriptional adapter 2 protein, putative [Theileria equi strain WA]
MTSSTPLESRGAGDERRKAEASGGDGKRPPNPHIKSRNLDTKGKNANASKYRDNDASANVVKAIGPYVQCSICSKLCSRQGHIKCAECVDFNICVKCFSSGLEKADSSALASSFVPSVATGNSNVKHKNTHKYIPVGPANFALFTKDWSAEQELLLVDAIAKYGLGNWTEVSEMVTMAYAGYKSEEECESHYYKIYLNSPTPPIPDLTSLVYDENGKPLIVHPSGVCPTQEKPKPAVSNKPQAKPQIIGYWPLRGDFDIEYDNDAELILADMEFRPEDTPEQIELKLNVIEIYNSKLDERIYRKKVIIERGLLDAKSLQQKERKYTSEEKELYNLLKPFLRFQTAEEHDQTVQLIVKERKLRSKLYQLMVWKTLGLKTQEDVRKYEEKVHRIEEYKDFLVKQESDPSRRHERRLRANALDLEASSGLAMNRLKITEFLDDNEIEFCESLQLPPISYFLAKRVLLQELACNTIYSVEDMCNELRIDGTKQGRIFDFLLMLSPKALRNMETEVCDLSKATLDNEGFIDHTKVVSQITLTNNNVAPVFDRFGCNKIATYMNSLDNEQEAKSVPIFGNQQKGGVSLERPIKQQKL